MSDPKGKKNRPLDIRTDTPEDGITKADALHHYLTFL